MLAIVATNPTDNARPTITTVKIFSNMILPSSMGVALLPRPTKYILSDNKLSSRFIFYFPNGKFTAWREVFPALLITLHRRRCSIQCRFHRLR